MADYRKMGLTPISMSSILRKAKKVKQGYTSIGQFVRDWRRLFSNAITFNLPNTDGLYEAAETLLDVFNEALVRLTRETKVSWDESMLEGSVEDDMEVDNDGGGAEDDTDSDVNEDASERCEDECVSDMDEEDST